MAVKHCVWHEASPAEQPFDSASLPLKNNVLHIRYVTQQEARYLNRLLLMSWLITYISSTVDSLCLSIHISQNAVQAESSYYSYVVIQKLYYFTALL